MIRAAVAELKLECLRAAGEAEQLVAQADSKDWLLAEQATDRGDCVFERLGVAGAVGEEYAIGFLRENFFRRGRAWENSHTATQVDQVPGNVPLHAVVERDDMRLVLTLRLRRVAGARVAVEMGPFTEWLLPLEGLVRKHFADEIAANQSGARFGLGDKAGIIQIVR